jgi:hypothetical protein
MGHADIRTTLNVYAKAVPGWESGAAAKVYAYLDRQDQALWPAASRLSRSS